MLVQLPLETNHDLPSLRTGVQCMERGKIKDDGINISDWLKSIAEFTGAVSYWGWEVLGVQTRLQGMVHGMPLHAVRAAGGMGWGRPLWQHPDPGKSFCM